MFGLPEVEVDEDDWVDHVDVEKGSKCSQYQVGQRRHSNHFKCKALKSNQLYMGLLFSISVNKWYKHVL